MKHIDFVSMKTSKRTEDEVQAVGLPYDPLPENYHLFLVNDVHEGNMAMCAGPLQKAIDAIKSVKRGYVALQGDQLEAVSVTDKRFDLATHAHRLGRIDAQRDSFMARFDPISDRVLWILDGNHERKLRNMCLPNYDLAEAWSTVYANGTLVKADFGKWKLGSWHGSGVVNSRAGDALQRATNNAVALKRNMRRLPVDDCDVVTCGHYHQCLVHPPQTDLALVSTGLELKHIYCQPTHMPVLGGDSYRIAEEDRWWMCCGGFLAAYSEDMPSYTEDAGYRPTELGYGHIEVFKGEPRTVEVVRIR